MNNKRRLIIKNVRVELEIAIDRIDIVDKYLSLATE